jgi:hypothetical protein
VCIVWTREGVSHVSGTTTRGQWLSPIFTSGRTAFNQSPALAGTTHVPTLTYILPWLLQSDRVLNLECGHMYHRQCLLPWLSQQATCPLCRHQVGHGATRGNGADGEPNEESIQLARMLAHFIPRIVSSTGLAPEPRSGYPTSTLNVTANPYAHYRGAAAHPTTATAPMHAPHHTPTPPEATDRRAAAAAAAERRRVAAATQTHAAAAPAAPPPAQNIDLD